MHACTARRALPGFLLMLPTQLAWALDPVSTSTLANTITALPQSQPATPTRPAASPASPRQSLGNELYLLADVGVVIPQDASIADISSTAGSSGLSGTSIALDPGVRFDVGLGFEVTNWFALEIASGLIWTGVNKVDGTILDTSGGIIGTDLPLSGGSGNIYNIPVMFNGQFRLPIGKNVKLLLGGGAGGIWSDANVGSIVTPLAPGLEATVDGSAWAFAYQGNAGVEWDITSNVTLGVRYAFLGTTELNYGAASFNTPLLVGTADIKANALYTHSILATLKLEF